MRPRPSHLFELLRRVLAASSAGLVLALTVFAASPSLHEELHEAEHHGSSHDGCVVAQFAGGVSVPAQILAPLPPLATAEVRLDASTNEFFWASPRYLHQPERGPPAAALH